jgi:hypothetical protein
MGGMRRLSPKMDGGNMNYRGHRITVICIAYIDGEPYDYTKSMSVNVSQNRAISLISAGGYARKRSGTVKKAKNKKPIRRSNVRQGASK